MKLFYLLTPVVKSFRMFNTSSRRRVTIFFFFPYSINFSSTMNFPRNSPHFSNSSGDHLRRVWTNICENVTTNLCLSTDFRTDFYNNGRFNFRFRQILATNILTNISPRANSWDAKKRGRWIKYLNVIRELFLSDPKVDFPCLKKKKKQCTQSINFYKISEYNYLIKYQRYRQCLRGGRQLNRNNLNRTDLNFLLEIFTSYFAPSLFMAVHASRSD